MTRVTLGGVFLSRMHAIFLFLFSGKKMRVYMYVCARESFYRIDAVPVHLLPPTNSTIQTLADPVFRITPTICSRVV